ncbi:MAG: zinc metallopeptidase [Clostridiales bacterium]|nr:zinc metallopeptidase [Clostridiales bacterium]
MYFDYTFILIIIGIIISLYAQAKVHGTYNRYAEVASRAALPAHRVARQILDSNGLSDVKIEQVAGRLSDHYDPRHKVVRLSKDVYNSTSLAAIGVAAHEAGHAMQDSEEYLPLKIRSAILPVASFGSNAFWIFIIAGAIFNMFGLIQAGIIIFAAAVLFQLVTLPVEFNASSKAIAALEGGGYLTREETPHAQKVLSAAAFTYVAAALVAVLQLLRLLLIFGRR